MGYGIIVSKLGSSVFLSRSMQKNLTFEAQPLQLYSLRNLHENGKICFSIDFEACYHKWSFRLIIDATTRDRVFSVAEFWKKYKMKHALENNQALQWKVTGSNNGRNFCHTVKVTLQGLNQM